MITAVISFGFESIGTWLALSSVVVAFIRFSIPVVERPGEVLEKQQETFGSAAETANAYVPFLPRRNCVGAVVLLAVAVIDID